MVSAVWFGTYRFYTHIIYGVDLKFAILIENSFVLITYFDFIYILLYNVSKVNNI